MVDDRTDSKRADEDKHSQGPWEVVGDPWRDRKLDPRIWTVVGGKPRAPGPVGDPHIYDTVANVGIDLDCFECEDESEGHKDDEHATRAFYDAKLIAAAPDLLRSLEAAIAAETDGYAGEPGWMPAAREAVRKARGRRQWE